MSGNYVVSINNRKQLNIVDLDQKIISNKIIHRHSGTIFFLFVVHDLDLFDISVASDIVDSKNTGLEIKHCAGT